MADPKETNPNGAQPALGNMEMPPIGEPEEQEKFFGDFDTREDAEQGFTALQARLDALERENQAALERERAANARLDRMISAPPSAAPAAAPAEPQLPELPNFVDDPNAFARSLEERILTQVSSAVKQATAPKPRDVGDMMSERLRVLHPKLAEHEAMLWGLVRNEAAAIKETGRDPDAAIRGDLDGFVNRVAETAYKQFQSAGVDLRAAPAEPGGSPTNENAGQLHGTPMPAAQQPAAEATRTAGVQGGTTPKQASAVDPTKQPEDPGSLTKELREIQDKTGFY